MELTILLPCLNEERTVGHCVDAAASFLRKGLIRGEILVADNSSTDRSRQVAIQHGARVVRASPRGYGNALRAGIRAARGTYIIVADADGSYDLAHLLPLLRQLRRGYDLVMGNRFWGGIAKGAMPWHHRYLGNPVLSSIGRLFFRTPARDFHCGLRGFTRIAADRMNLQSGGMELASEIVIKASLLGMRVCEVPTTLQPDGRGRRPHLRSFPDGWRHLRFLLLFSPRWLFAYPGLAMVLLGSAATVVLALGPLHSPLRLFDFHSYILAGSLVVVGTSTLWFYVISRVYSFTTSLLPSAPEFYRFFPAINLEKGLAVGFVVLALGVVILFHAVQISALAGGFESIGYGRSVRLVFGGSLALILGTQTIFASFFLSMLGMGRR